MSQEELFKVFSKAYEFLQAHSIHDVRNLAREFGVKSPTASKKDAIAAELISLAAGLIEPRERSPKGAKSKSAKVPEAMLSQFKALVREGAMLLSYEGVEKVGVQVLQFNDSGKANLIDTKDEQAIAYGVKLGILDCVYDIYYLREMDYIRREEDCIVPKQFVRQRMLKKGDILECGIERQNDKWVVVDLRAINGRSPSLLILNERDDFDTDVLHPQPVRLELNKDTEPFMRAMQEVLPLTKGSQIAISKLNMKDNDIFLKFLEYLQCVAINTVLFIFAEENFEQENIIKNNFPFTTVISRKNLTTKAMLDSLFLVLEQRKRAIEFGSDIVFVIDDIMAMAQLFEQAEKMQSSIEMQTENLTAKSALKNIFSAAKMYKDIGSLTICTFFEENEENKKLMQELIPRCSVVLYFQQIENTLMIDFEKSYVQNWDTLLSLEAKEKLKNLKTISAKELLNYYLK